VIFRSHCFQKYGLLFMGFFQTIKTCTLGSWALGHLGSWALGHLGSRALNLGSGARGLLGTWVLGHVGACVCGLLGLGTYLVSC
jgi:hypothetical protein